MNVQLKRQASLGLAAAALMLASVAAAQQYPPCPQDHPGRQHRAESVAKKGDSRMTKSVAGHVVRCATVRYRLAGLVSQADIDRAQQEIYNFLCWKLGSPTTVAGQFVTAGYQHFDKAYVDEAAGSLIGIVEFTKKAPDLMIPDWLIKKIQQEVKEEGANQIAEYLESEYSIPPELSKPLAEKITGALASKIPTKVGISMPKSYDIDNRLVEGAIAARRSGPGAIAVPVGGAVRRGK